MDFLTLTFKNQKDYLSDPDNLKEIRGYFSTLKYEAIQSTSSLALSYIEDMYIYIRCLGGHLKECQILFSEGITFHWDSNLVPENERSLNNSTRNLMELFIYSLSNFIETVTALTANLFILINHIGLPSNQDTFLDGFFSMLGGNLPLLMIKSQLNGVIVELESHLSELWENCSENIEYVYLCLYQTIKKYPDIFESMSDDWKNLIDYTLRNIEIINFPPIFEKISLELLTNKGLGLSTRILLRSWYLDNQDRDYEIVSFYDTCQDMIQSIKKYLKNSSEFGDVFMSIPQVNSFLEHTDFCVMKEKDVEDIVFILGRLIKSYKKDDTLVETNYTSIISQASKIISKAFENHESLLNTYLVRHVAISLVNFIQEKGNIIEQVHKEMIDNLLIQMEVSPYLCLYIASLYEEKSLDVLKSYFSRVFREIYLKNKIEQFSNIIQKPECEEFIDHLTESIIIVPSILKNGDNIMWVDKHMMTAHLKEKSENPYTRENLTLDEWTAYNEEMKKMIDEYGARRKLIINKNSKFP